ncbi:MAG: sugar kinase [Desulfobacula sp.]|nr:sugar kinase [Desulfobacula sp.]
MNKKYLMAVDVGTQSAKVIIFDLDGNIICQGTKELRKLDIPAPLLAEHPDDDLWDTLKTAFQIVMNRFKNDAGGDAGDILAMGICIIRCCRVLLKSNGRLAHPVINWMDKRLNSPYEYCDGYGDVQYVTTSSGYITHRLTGEFKDTCANYIGWWPMDNDTCDWSQDPKAMNTCNIPRDMLFDLVKPGDILGTISEKISRSTGIPQGLPVVATAHDKAVEALGAGSLAPGTALISLGTYIGAMVHGHKNMKDSKNFWSFQAAVPGQYLYECMGVRRGMWTVSWFCDQFGSKIIDDAKQLNLSIEEMFNRQAEQIPPGCEGLLTIHDWAPPAEAVFRKGVMLGFDGRHTRAHIYRSILEGIAFTMKNHMDKMADELAAPIEKLIISGGGANSKVFMQIFADVFGIKAHRNQMKGSAAVGCAINAGMAVGVFDSYDQAIRKMVRKGDSFGPDSGNHRLYSCLNDRVYSHANQYLDPLLRKLSPMVD